jgi:polyferredoxin
MEGILLAFFISFIGIVFSFEMAAFASCGWFIPNKLLNEALDKHIPKGTRLNSFDDDIISIEYSFTGSWVEISLFTYEPCIYDILVNIVCSFPGIFV